MQLEVNLKYYAPLNQAQHSLNENNTCKELTHIWRITCAIKTSHHITVTYILV